MPAEAKYAFTQFFSMPLDPSLVIFYRRHSPAAPRLRPASVASSSINHSCGQFQKLLPSYGTGTVVLPVVLLYYILNRALALQQGECLPNAI